ncbi:hypothetical protein [Endozoicomonas sp. 8E]|uniref:hypothetical protein n=1 Tax=Endozoicomonas sp. 8E TaxID=3035692 RepID=UPI002938F40F|nr:hypothetical protein [Endozoicomonas sp. 8E]WOG27080.1 hypothetical protein P6910_21395 [Endozoicomonas sp. 8E]
MSVVCQARPWTGRFIVKPEQDAVSPDHKFSIKPDRRRLSRPSSDIGNTDGCGEAVMPPDKKRQKIYSYEIKKTLIESISWQWLYATKLLVAYELILTTKDNPLDPTLYQAVAKMLTCSGVRKDCWSFATSSYSWVPLEASIAVGWLLKSLWNSDSPLFNPIVQKEVSQNRPFAITIVMPGSEHNPAKHQHQPSDSSGEQAPQVTTHPKSSFTSFLCSGEGKGDPQQHSHTLGLNCLVHPCHGVCQFRPSSDSNEHDEWPPNSLDDSTGQTGQNSQACLANGSCFSCRSHFDSINATHSMSAGATNTDPAGPLNCNVRMSGHLPVTVDDLVIINALLSLRGQIRARDHSTQPICDVPVVMEDGLQRPCGKVFRNAQALSSHKSKYHTGQKTCDAPLVLEDGHQQLCGTVCKNAQALMNHKSRFHTGQQTCDKRVIDKYGQRRPCGRICKNARVLASHKSRYHTGQKTCDMKLVREDGQQQPCGTVCKNAQALSDHKRGDHSGQKTCNQSVIGENGQQQPCGEVCRSAKALSDHKRRYHTGQRTCEVTVIIENGQQQSCGKVCKNALDLSNHKRVHRKRRPVDVEQGD